MFKCFLVFKDKSLHFLNNTMNGLGFYLKNQEHLRKLNICHTCKHGVVKFQVSAIKSCWEIYTYKLRFSSMNYKMSAPE